MNWYEELGGVRVIPRRHSIPIKKLTPEKEQSWFDELAYYRDKLYKEWDKVYRMPIPYSAKITDEKDVLTLNTFRTLDIQPKRASYRMVMSPEIYKYLEQDINLNQECVNNMIDKTIGHIKADLKEQVIQCLYT